MSTHCCQEEADDGPDDERQEMLPAEEKVYGNRDTGREERGVRGRGGRERERRRERREG